MKINLSNKINSLKQLSPLERTAKIGLEKTRQHFNKTHSYQIPTKNDKLSLLTSLYVDCMDYFKKQKGK